MTAPNGQTTLVPIVTSGFHAGGLQLPPGAIYATDHSALLSHVTGASSGPNGLLPMQQRTDRLTV